MTENKLCRKCHERPVANEILPFCPYCWNHLDSTIPEERNALVYYGNKMYYAKHPELEKKDKEQKRKWHNDYIAKNREKWNAYQREYKKRKAAENKALKQRVAELEQQLNSMTRVDNAQLVR